MSDPDGGPYLLTSVLCKEVLNDREGNPMGVSGISSSASVDGGHLPVRVEVKVFVVLVAGQGRGKPFYVQLHPVAPSGAGLGYGTMPIRFTDDEHAIATIAVDYAMDLKEPGVHWIDVGLTPHSGGSTRLLTRMPFELVVHRTGQTT
jgi:hypothetical protein